ncbi:MAG: hypothetical protein Q9170_001639 [Blastenia crenularia]
MAARRFPNGDAVWQNWLQAEQAWLEEEIEAVDPEQLIRFAQSCPSSLDALPGQREHGAVKLRAICGVLGNKGVSGAQFVARHAVTTVRRGHGPKAAVPWALQWAMTAALVLPVGFLFWKGIKPWRTAIQQKWRRRQHKAAVRRNRADAILRAEGEKGDTKKEDEGKEGKEKKGTKKKDEGKEGKGKKKRPKRGAEKEDAEKEDGDKDDEKGEAGEGEDIDGKDKGGEDVVEDDGEGEDMEETDVEETDDEEKHKERTKGSKTEENEPDKKDEEDEDHEEDKN